MATQDVFSAALLADIQKLAEADQKTPEELVSEALRVYEKQKDSWRRLLTNGAARAKALGYTEADVPRLVKETRREFPER